MKVPFDLLHEQVKAIAEMWSTHLDGEAPHTISVSAYFDNRVISHDVRMLALDDDPSVEVIDLMPSSAEELDSFIRRVIDGQTATVLSMYSFHNDQTKLATKGMFDQEQATRQYVVGEIMRQIAELRELAGVQCERIAELEKKRWWSLW